MAVIWAIYITFGIYIFYLLNLKKVKVKTGVKKRLGNDQLETIVHESESDVDQTLENFPESMAIIRQDIYQDKFLSKNYFLIFQLQVLGIVVMLATTQISGLAQTFFYLVFTSIYIIYFIYTRPFKKRLLYAIVLVNETGQLALGVIAVILGMNDLYAAMMSEDAKNAIGIAMIVIISGLMIFGFLVVMITVTLQVIKNIKLFRTWKNQRRVKPVRSDDGPIRLSFNDTLTKMHLDSQVTVGEGIKRRKIILD